MIDATFTYFDAAVLGIMVLSCLFAFFRGIIKEILSLGAWIGAGIITLFYFRDIAEWLKPHFKSEMVAGGLATLGLYVVLLMAFSMLNMLIMRFVKEGSDVGILDNAFGLIFGALRGAFIVSLGFLMMTMVMNEDTYPKWLKASMTLRPVEKGAIMLGRISPDYLREHSSLKDKIEGHGKEEKTAPVEFKEGETNEKMDNFIKNMKDKKE